MEWLVHTYLHDCESSGYQHFTSLSVLQAGAVKGELHKTDYKRLNLGVAAAAIALTAVRVLHWDTQSILGHLETVMQGGLTGVMPPGGRCHSLHRSKVLSGEPGWLHNRGT